MQTKEDGSIGFETIQFNESILWLFSIAIVIGNKLFIRLSIQTELGESDCKSLLEEDHITSSQFHPLELAYSAITVELEGAQLVAYAEQKTRPDAKGNHFGSYLFGLSELAAVNFVTKLLINYPQSIYYWVDDTSEPVGWTSMIAIENGFKYQGNQPNPTFLKEIFLSK